MQELRSGRLLAEESGNRQGFSGGHFDLMDLMDYVQRTPAHLVVDPADVFPQQTDGDELDCAQK